MLRALHMKDVGPAARFDLELGERLNVLTGDNGLGKSFVLDVAWWALTGTWVGKPVLPQSGKEDSAELAGELDEAESAPHRFHSAFVRIRQNWSAGYDQRNNTFITNYPGPDISVWLQEQVPVLYIRADGDTSVWDPVRNHQKSPQEGGRDYVKSSGVYHFDTKALWDGLRREDKLICNGLVQDWVTWQLEAGSDESSPFQLLCSVLAQLSHPAEKMKPGKPVRLYLDDVRKFPTVELPYGTVPVIHASAGMRRIISLAYLITWAWTEHVDASRLLGWKPAQKLVVLLEEPETHLHPRWQRHVVPALMNVLSGLTPEMRPQILLTTHSPLVLASLEPHFNQTTDRLFLFELHGGEVTLRDVPWVKRGDAISWLTSPIFGLDQGRSIEAERAIEAAEALMRGELAALPEGLRTEDEIHRELLRVLPDQDRFWPRWIVRRERSSA
jgi:hypothetical protein